MLVISGYFKHFTDPKLISGIESRMLDYTEINISMEIKANGHHTLFDTAQGILLVLVRDTQDVCSTVKLTIGFVPGLGRKQSSTALAGKKNIKTIFTNASSIVYLDLFLIQLTRSDNLDHLHLAIAKESKRTKSACCAISGEKFGNETVLTALVPQ